MTATPDRLADTLYNVEDRDFHTAYVSTDDVSIPLEMFVLWQADAIRAALRDGTLSPEDLGMDPVTLFVRGDDGIARQITAYLPQEAPDA